MHIYIWWDHYTLEIKEQICWFLEKRDMKWTFYGSTTDEDKIPLEEFIEPVCKKVLENNSLWILLCGTGAWVSIGANKMPWIRAICARKPIDALWWRQKDNANILCFSWWDTPKQDLEEALTNWFETKFENQKIMKSMEIMDNWK